MAVPLVVNGITYNYPVNEDESYGVNATDWAIAITDVVDITYVPGDVQSVNFNISYNGTTQNVAGAIFDNTEVRGFSIHYCIEIASSTPANNQTAHGTLRAVYSAYHGWVYDNDYVGSTTYVLNVDGIGQVTYNSTSVITGVTIAKMSYRAFAIPL